MGEPTLEVTGAAREAFGTECKVGDSYLVTVTATEVSPERIAFTIDSVEPEYEEEAAPETPAPAKSKTAAMTYA